MAASTAAASVGRGPSALVTADRFCAALSAPGSFSWLLWLRVHATDAGQAAERLQQLANARRGLLRSIRLRHGRERGRCHGSRRPPGSSCTEKTR
eukprot:7377564-Prymnesium_polylepis.3